MKSRREQLALAWIEKASRDLENARLLIEQEKRLLDVAVFHCQQAAEKALKAWLTGQEVIFPKTHDLELLLRLCATGEQRFSGFSEQARWLTPLASAFRYPGDSTEPEPAQASQALHFASNIFTFCEARIRSQQK